MIIKYLFCSQTLRFLKVYLVFIRSMQFKKKCEQEQSLVGFEQGSAGFEQGAAGFEQGSANYIWVRTGYCRVHIPSYSLGVFLISALINHIFF